ncbi:alpha/beta hydrolase [Myxococcaceae bacterium GXIMD 01537]
MRQKVLLTELGGGAGPRVLLLPGLGARGSGFRAFARHLSRKARPVLVEYPEGRHAAQGARVLAEQVLAETGPVDAVVASSFGGMVAGWMAAGGLVRGVAFLGSFSRLEHLGPRGRLIALMGPIAVLGRPGLVAASLASWRRVPDEEVSELVPTTSLERMSTWHRAFAVGREEPAPELRGHAVTCVCIQGDRDVLVPASTMPRLAASLPPGTTQHLLRGAGHVPYHSHPEECVRLLDPWLDLLSGPPGHRDS